MSIKETIKPYVPEPMRKVYRYVRHPRRIVRRCREYCRMREVLNEQPIPLPACSEGHKEKIVSLTSYGTRLKSVHLAIKSIMLQTVLPNRVVLYLEDPISEKDLPEELLDLKQFGLELRFGCEDLKPHKKWYYAFQEFPDALIITIDDDLLFPKDAIECLMRQHEIFPDAVITRRAHLMRFADDGTPMSYSDWVMEWKDPVPGPRRLLLATGCGGAIYPAAAFDPDTIDIDVIRTEALYADDIYLKILEILNDIPVVYAPNNLNHPYSIRGTQEGALCRVNVNDHRNDAILEALLKRYRLTARDFQDDA